MVSKATGKASCWQIKLPEKLMKRLENVSGSFNIEKRTDGGSPVQLIIDDELSRVARALFFLHAHKIADNIQTCPESIDTVELSHLSATDRRTVRESHKNIVWQRTLFRARQHLQMSGLVLPAVDGVEPALWPNAEVLLHRLQLRLHAIYNARDIPVEDLEWAICMQESERLLSGKFVVNEMRDPGKTNPSWLVRNSIAERRVTKRLTVHSKTQYYALSDIEVTKMGHRRLEILVEGVLNQAIGQSDGSSDQFHGPKVLQQALLDLFPIDFQSGNVPQEFLWNRLIGANFTFLTPAFEAVLTGDTPLAKRRLMQFLCSATVRGGIYNTQLSSETDSQHVHRTQKISISPGVHFLFVCFSDAFKAENISLKNFGNVVGLVYGSSVAMNAHVGLYMNENVLRSIHLKQFAGDKESEFRADQRFFVEKYNLQRYQGTKIWATKEQRSYSTPFIIPDDGSDILDLAPALFHESGGKSLARRRKHHLKNTMDDKTMQDVLVQKFRAANGLMLNESDIYHHFGDGHRTRAILSKVAILGRSVGRTKSWVLRQEFSNE